VIYLGDVASLAMTARRIFNLTQEVNMWIVWLFGAGAAILAWVVWKSKVQSRKVAGTLLYLYVCSLLLLYAAYGVWAAKSEQSAQRFKALPACAPGSALAVEDLDPDRVIIGAPQLDMRVLGCGFERDDKVALSGSDRQFIMIDASQLLVRITAADIATPRDHVVVVSKGAATSSGILRVGFPPAPRWSFFGWHWLMTEDLRLVLIVLLMGPLGSSISALKSLADYLGGGKPMERPLVYYLIQPPQGFLVAFVVFVVIRAGFIGGEFTGGNSADLKKACAIVLLAGMFSDVAFLKLKDLFGTILSVKNDDRGGRIDGLKAPSRIRTRRTGQRK
jgi:hypothetical protein